MRDRRYQDWADRLAEGAIDAKCPRYMQRLGSRVAHADATRPASASENKFEAIAKAKEAARESIELRIKPAEVESLEPGSELYKRVIECRYVAGDAKLVAAYWPDYSLFTVEETPVL